MSIKDLCKVLEQVSGRTIQTPQDFDFLSSSIFEKTHQTVSASTLKRIYGYVTSGVSARRSTLDILCQYVGYRDWSTFCRKDEDANNVESNPLLAVSMNADEVCEDDRLVVSWKPNRECVFRCTGYHRFVVEESRNSKLQPGDTFECHLFIKGEPLYLDNVVMQGALPVRYVCGRDNGVLFFLAK